MRGPLVAKVSRRCIAAKSDSREFSSAHAPIRPPGLRITQPAPAKPGVRDMRFSSGASVSAQQPT